MENKFYIQCRMQKNNISIIEWIEEKYAVIGNTLTVKLNDKWESDYRVISFGGKIDAETLLAVIHMNFAEVKED
jgi:hypothetical protein